MLTRFTGACALLGVKALADKINFADKFLDDYKAWAEFDDTGHCLGLSKKVFGTPGPYVTSDVQYALQFADLIL